MYYRFKALRMFTANNAYIFSDVLFSLPQYSLPANSGYNEDTIGRSL